MAGCGTLRLRLWNYELAIFTVIHSVAAIYQCIHSDILCVDRVDGSGAYLLTPMQFVATFIEYTPARLYYAMRTLHAVAQRLSDTSAAQIDGR